MRHAWERRERENDWAWLTFHAWLTSATPRPGARLLLQRLAEQMKSGTLRGVECLPSARQVERYRQQHDWDLRAAKYDSHLLKAEVDARVKAREAVGQPGELENYRQRVANSAKILMGLGTRLAMKANQCLDTIDNGDAPPSSLSTAARASGYLIQTAIDAEAALLGIDDLIGTLARSRPDDTIASDEGE